MPRPAQPSPTRRTTTTAARRPLVGPVASIATVCLVLAGLATPRAAAAQGTGGTKGGATPFIIGNDTTPPTVTISPSGGNQPSVLTITVTFCDTQSNLSLGTRAFTLNGVSVYSSFTGGTITQAGCYAAARYSGQVALAYGNNSFYAAMNDQVANVGQEWAQYTVPQAPTIVTNDWNPSDFHDVTHCVVNCFESTLSYSTPAYISRDKPRSVTLLYRSGSAAPRPTVVVHANDASITPAQSLSVLLQSAGGTYVPLTNGSTELYWAGGAGNHWLPIQFDASSLPTGAYDYSAIVISHWADSTTRTSVLPVRVLVVNERNSPFGAGWSIAGLQRVSKAGTSVGALVTDGGGSAVFFPGCGGVNNCTFGHAEGDFSTLYISSTGTYARTYPDGTVINYDATGRETSTHDRFNSTTQYAYFSSGIWNGDLSTITDPVGQVTTFAYADSNSAPWKPGTLRGIYTPAPGGAAARTAYFGVNSAGDLTNLLDVDNVYFGFAAYDGSHRLTQFTDRRGGVWNYTYATDGSLASTLAPNVTVNGQSTRPTTTLVAPSTNVFTAFTGTVGTSGNPLSGNHDVRASVTDPLGHVTYYYVRRWGVLNTTDPLNRTSSFAYDSTDGRLINATPYGGRNVTYTWDGPRLTLVADALTHDSTFITYEPVYSQVKAFWGTNVIAGVFVYDTTLATRPLKSYYRGIANIPNPPFSPPVAPSQYSVDSLGRVFAVVDLAGHADSVRFESTGLQNTDSTIESLGRKTAVRRDAYGRPVAVVEPVGSTDSTVYDLLNRVVGSVSGAGLRTTFDFDSLFLRAVIDPTGARYEFVHNALGWVEQAHRPDTTAQGYSTIQHAFDAAGQLVSVTNRRGQVISFAYDAYGRDTVRIAGTDTAHFVFGEFATPDVNNISSYVVGWNHESRDSLAFDVRGRLATVNTMRRGIPYGIRHVFNTDGTLAQRYVTSILWPTAKADSFSYNIAGALVKYVAFGLKDTIALDGDNLATSITAPNGLVNSLAITSGHDSYQTAYSGPNGTDVNNRLGVSLFYDQDGRIVDHRRVATSDSLHKHIYGSDGWLDSRRVYGTTVQSGCVYDPRGGVVCNQDQILTTENYSYDGAGNLLNGVTRVEAGNRVRAANGTTYDYDADGNLSHVSASGVTKSLTWSPLGTLTGVTITGTGAATVSYGYDAFGRRVRKTINTDTTGYLWDGSLLSMELSASGQPIAEYSNWGGVDSPRAVKRGGVVYYFAMDPVSGSVHGLIRASDDSVVAQYGYTPYGTLEAGSFDSAASGPNPIRYQGREYDNETGLYYFRARYYDPTLGRFISEDPLGLAGGSANLYEFAGNDPVNGDDPSGAMFGGTIGINFFNNCTEGSILGQKETICIHWGRKGALQKSPSYDYAQYRYSAMLAAAIKNAPPGTGPQPAWMHEPGLESGGWADPLFLLGGWEGAAADDLVERGLMKLAPEARVFYSGAGAKAAAEVWAKATGSVTIEMTEAGQQLERLTAGMDRVAARDLWKPLSADFASGADGVVHVFHGLSVSMESVWATVEYPILAANPNVSIMYHVVW